MERRRRAKATVSAARTSTVAWIATGAGRSAQNWKNGDPTRSAAPAAASAASPSVTRRSRSQAAPRRPSARDHQRHAMPTSAPRKKPQVSGLKSATGCQTGSEKGSSMFCPCPMFVLTTGKGGSCLSWASASGRITA
jgi:hypothetical protein